MDLNHANALVTGGSDGYGRGIAKVLKDAGANVWITGRNAAKLSKTAAELGVRAIQADVSSGSDWDRVINETGDLDILINNAGNGGRIVPVLEQTDDDIIRTINVNLTGELRPFGVRVTCVTPSWGQTGFNQAANIRGASEDPALAAKCIAPEELGAIIRSIIEQPDHLAVPDITVQPVIQDISPM